MLFCPPCTKNTWRNNVLRKKKSTRWIIYSSSDDENTAFQKRNQCSALEASPIQSTWTWDKNNRSALSLDLDDLPWVDSFTFYVGGSIKSFLYTVENKHISSTFFLFPGKLKIWYAVSKASKMMFKRNVDSKVLEKEFLNNYTEGLGQIIG